MCPGNTAFRLEFIASVASTASGNDTEQVPVLRFDGRVCPLDEFELKQSAVLIGVDIRSQLLAVAIQHSARGRIGVLTAIGRSSVVSELENEPGAAKSILSSSAAFKIGNKAIPQLAAQARRKQQASVELLSV